ncbi:hypothetical protein ACFL54_05100 [Planctomycetota bacterium]
MGRFLVLTIVIIVLTFPCHQVFGDEVFATGDWSEFRDTCISNEKNFMIIGGTDQELC